MSSIQERLQLKRVPLDTWNIREQLCLASAVVRSGDQNWMSVSRALKTVGESNRPADWYSQKSCAAQYGALLEHVETPKRKKRSSEGAVETPQESILKRLTQERIVEIQKNVAEMTQQYEQIKNEIAEARNPSTSEERIRELWGSIEAAKRVRERESARRTAWLKEREERRARAERTWRPPAPQTPTSTGGTSPAPAPSSPLLTSLLKSSPVVTTPQHITHPANVVETVSPSAGAPTLSMLLDKCAATTPSAAVSVASSNASVPNARASIHDNKHAAIEHIKSQLVQIERNFTAATTTPRAPSPLLPPVATPASTPALDIDDIEIKAEDVYAFSDIDIHLPPVAHMHKSTARPAEKPMFKKDDLGISVPEVMVPAQIQDEVKEELMDVENMTEEVLPVDIESIQEQQPMQAQEEQPKTPEAREEPEVKIAFPEVKFPTPEIKVIQSDELKVKEEVREPEVLPAEEERQEEVRVEEDAPAPPSEPVEETRTEPQVTEVPVEIVPPPAEDAPAIEETQMNPGDIPLPDDSVVEASQDNATELIPTIEVEVPPPEIKQEAPQHSLAEAESEAPEGEAPASEAPQIGLPESGVADSVEVMKVEDVKKEDEDAEDSIPLQEMVREETAHAQTPAPAPEPEAKEEAVVEMETETHTETDDDTPMELSREEEKDGKKKRDYSRKKKADSRTCSGSESAEASAPESPSANDAERQHRQWKKSVMLVYSRLCAHKYASLFLRPISDEEAPGYSLVVRRPMDLTTIRRHIDAGVIRTTSEFQRDVLLMLSNALMYNSNEHSVYAMAMEMHEEAVSQLGMLLAAQAHAGLAPPAPAPATRKRRRHDSPHAPAHPRH